MVLRKFFKALGRVFGFKKRKKRRAPRKKRQVCPRRRPVSHRKKGRFHRETATRKKKRVVKRVKRPRPHARRAVRPKKIQKRSNKSPWVPAGEISHYFPKVKAAVLRCRAPLAIGDAIWIKGTSTDFRQTIGSMQIDRKAIVRAKRGQEIGLEVFSDVRVGDRVFLTRV